MKNFPYALKALRAQPVFFATAVLTLALGVGFNALMFSAVYGAFMRPLPFPQADFLVSLETLSHKLGVEVRTTPADFFDWRDQVTTLSHLGAYTSSELHVFSNGEARRLPGATVTIGFFDTLGVQPIIGRLLEDKDFERSPLGAVVLSEGFWHREFGGERSALDEMIKVTSRPYRIVGVISDDARLDTQAEVWVPMAIDRSQASRRSRFLKVIGRRQPTATLEAVEAEMATIALRLATAYPETNDQHGIRVATLRATLLRDFPEKLATLWGAVASILLMICANISLLVLSNTARRQGNFAIRIALGASHRQVTKQLLTETMVVAMSGGVLGLVVAAMGFKLLRRLVPDPVLLAQIHLSGETVVFALGLSLLIGLVLGCIAALRVPKHALRTALSSNDRGQVGTRSQYLQKALVVTEVAITVALTMSSALMLRSLHQLWTVDPGYDVESISTVSVLFPPRTYPPGSEQLGNYLRQAVEVLEALPSVDRAASGFLAPLEGTGQGLIQAEGVDFGDLNETSVALQAVSSGYFETMGLEIKIGRTFDDHEHGGVALANDVLVRLLFGEEAALGKRLKLSSALSQEPHHLEVVGIVESERLTDLAEGPTPTLYVPHELELFPIATLYVRQANRSAVGLSRSMQEVLRELDPEVAVSSPKSIRMIFRDSLHEEASVTLLLGISGGIALILALIGVFGTWTLFVRERQREFGIRLSLGARPDRIMREILYKNLKLTAAGIGVGTLLALSTTRFIKQWLFGIQDNDPGTLVSIVALVTIASVVAGIIPAWKASRVDVMEILRDT